ITLEEHSVIGGLGDAVASAVIGKGDFKFKKLGIQDRFGQSGKPADLLKEYGLDDAAILSDVKSTF
ncbi:MAG: transketolase C-terminal domain-containing protein, partial [Oscillospiraceae bacterium]